MAALNTCAADRGFNLDEATDRRGIGSLKWDVAEGELPMWVADMDFKAAPCVLDALQKRLDNGTFGYSVVPDEYLRTVTGWWAHRHGVSWREEDVVFATGAIPALSSLVRSLTNVAEYVVVQPPVYNMFFNSIVNNGRRIMASPLRYDAQARTYEMDFEGLEECLSHPQTTLMVLCNPHNPTGNVWTREELARVGELCARHDVTVVSDELHCETNRPGFAHTPFAAASQTCRDISVTLGSTSKAFNLAGLQSAYMLVDNPRIKARAVRGLNTDECAEPNAFALAATTAAYAAGEEWLEACRDYIWANKALLREALAAGRVPGVSLVDGNATYLAWLDCSELMERAGMADSAQLAEAVRRESGLVLSDGIEYGEPGRFHLRMNLGTCRSRVEEGVARLARACTALI